jgi:hypothetical protein
MGKKVFTNIVLADKDESDLVMVSNESGTDSNPRKWQGTLLSFFTNPIVKKSKADRIILLFTSCQLNVFSSPCQRQCELLP